MEGKSIGILLGDKRQYYIGEIFKEWGYEVFTCHQREEKFLLKCKNIVLPTPFALSENRIFEFIYKMREGQMLFSSKIPRGVRQKLEKRAVRVFDFLEEEEIAVSNAHITAEGIIAAAMIKYRGTIRDSNCLVLGYGKCGKAIARKLKALGAKVTVCTIDEKEICKAREEGFFVISFEQVTSHIKGQQLIFHTIPVLVMTRECFFTCDKEVLIFDIVSSRVKEAKWAMECGIDYEIYPKIPEKYAPKAAAMIFAKYIESQIEGVF